MENREGAALGAEGSNGLTGMAMARKHVEKHWRNFYPQSASGFARDLSPDL